MICVDGCDRAVYRVLDDWRRSPRSVAAVDEDLLCDQLEEDGGSERLDDGDVVIRVHLLHDVTDVSDGQTVEHVQQDDDHEEHEKREDDVAEPVGELNLTQIKK